jgi:hypothetical protein
MLPEVGVAPVLPKVGVAVDAAVPTDPLVTLRVSSSVPVPVAAAVRIRPAAAIGGSSYEEYF